MPDRRILALCAMAALVLLMPAPVPAGAESVEGEGPPHPLPVFRSVLNQNPRMITVPLNEDMWLAYDPEVCMLKKAWAGTVNLDGAVYTTEHGPQPTSSGPLYIEQGTDAQLSWDADDFRYLGYRVDDRRVTLRWRLRYGRSWVTVEETPSFIRSKDGRPGLRREFRVRGRARHAPQVIVNAYGLTGVRSNTAITRDASWFFPPPSPGVSQTAITIHLNRRRVTWVETYFDKAMIDAGARAAAELDAKHKADSVTKGDAPAEAPEPVVLEHPEDTPVGNGVSVRVYQIAEAAGRIRKLVPGQTPNVSHVIPVLDLRTERGDFGELTEDFITHVDGFIEIAKAGTYAFRLTSDDGSRLFIDDTPVVDHDGLHGPTDMDGTVQLGVGRHKLFVEHFERGGGEQLTLSWKPPGATEFVIVPNSVLRAPKGEVRVTSPGTKKIVAISSPGTPGDGKPLTAVHPAYDLAQARPKSFKPRIGGMDWLPDGRLVVCCWEPLGGVYALEGVDGDDPEQIKVTRIAAGLAEPLGLRVVDGRLYVLQKQELTELIDHDGDGLIDEYRAVAAGWGVTDNFHEFAFGLVYKHGTFWATLATAINPGGASTSPQNEDRGKVIRIWPNGRYEFVAHGLRTPNGIGIGYDDQIYVTDNQGDWLPVSKLMHVSKGAFFGNRSVDPEGTAELAEKPPVVWLPQGEIGNSPGEPGMSLDGPYKGQMLHADVTHGGLKRVFVEKVEGQYQGCVFRFTQGLEAGINRWTRGPDGALYVGGIGSAGNWGQAGKLKHGLQRLRYNGKSVFEMKAVRATGSGFEIEFTEPLAEVNGNRPEDYLVEQWRYEPTKAYGGPKKDVEELEIQSVWVSQDRRRVRLLLADRKPEHVVYIRLRRTVRSVAGAAAWTTEAWYTQNKVPPSGPDVVWYPEPFGPPNELSATDLNLGFELLFDGTSLKHWRGYKKDAAPSAWKVDEGTLHFSKDGDGGDLITKEQYTNFDFRFEWRVAPGGNSGVCYRIKEEGGAMWATGPEYQILDNEAHGDGISPMTSAGACYALYPPAMDVTRPAGSWNQARIRIQDGVVTHWLNGWKLVEADMRGDDWASRIEKSKFKSMTGFGVQPSGHIGLQDHGDKVWYRNLKIRALGGDG